MGTALITGIRGPCRSQKETPPQYPCQERANPDSRITTSCTCRASESLGVTKRVIDPTRGQTNCDRNVYPSMTFTYLRNDWKSSNTASHPGHLQTPWPYRGWLWGEWSSSVDLEMRFREKIMLKNVFSSRNMIRSQTWCWCLLSKSLYCMLFPHKNTDFYLICEPWALWNQCTCAITACAALKREDSCCESTSKSICNYLVPLSRVTIYFDQDCLGAPWVAVFSCAACCIMSQSPPGGVCSTT